MMRDKTETLVLLLLPLLLVFCAGCGMTDYEHGMRHVSNQRWERAIELFERALEEEPDNPVIYYQLAEASSKIKRHGEAWRYYERFLELALAEFPEVETEILERIRREKIEEAMLKGEAGDVDKALDMLSEADPDRARILAGDLALRRGELDVARATYNNAFMARGREEDNAFIAELHLARARLYREYWQRDRDKSDFFRIFRELRLARVMVHPEPSFHAYVEVLFADLRRQPEFKAYAPVDDAYNVLHRSEREGDYEQALLAAQNIIRLSPLYDDLFYGHHKIGDIMMRIGEYQQAYEHYQRALVLSEAIPDIIVVGLRYRIDAVAEIIRSGATE